MSITRDRKMITRVDIVNNKTSITLNTLTCLLLISVTLLNLQQRILKFAMPNCYLHRLQYN